VVSIESQQCGLRGESRDEKSKVLINPELFQRFRLAKGERSRQRRENGRKSFNKSTTLAPLSLFPTYTVHKM
jgi:stalled ribosome alternative rescue factor ArfA